MDNLKDQEDILKELFEGDSPDDSVMYTACFKALVEADFSDAQKRYLLARTYKEGAPLDEFLGVVRHSFYSVLNNAWAIYTAYDEEQQRSEDTFVDLISCMKHNAKIYSGIIGLNLDYVESPKTEPANWSFPQILKFLSNFAGFLEKRYSPQFPDLNSKVDNELKRLNDPKHFQEKGENLFGFVLDEWKSLPTKNQELSRYF